MIASRSSRLIRPCTAPSRTPGERTGREHLQVVLYVGEPHLGLFDRGDDHESLLAGRDPFGEVSVDVGGLRGGNHASDGWNSARRQMLDHRHV